MYKSIFLIGFRGSGKSTVGAALAERLGWELVDMDSLIEERAGKSINQLTQAGKDWQGFRQMESDLLVELMERKGVVVSTGGGATTNSIVKDGGEKTFGEINSLILGEAEGSLVVFLTADEKVLGGRIREQENEKSESVRPILDEKRAKEVREYSREALIQAIVDDSLKIYRSRMSLYERQADMVVDTGKVSVEEAVEKICKLVGGEDS